MRLAYITNTLVPSTKANTKQSFTMSAALAATGFEVTMVYPDRQIPKPLRNKDPFEFYGLQPSFNLHPVPCIDRRILARIIPSWWFALLKRSFHASLLAHLQAHPYDLIYVRDGSSLPGLIKARSDGQFNSPIAFEVHKRYPQLREPFQQVDALVTINEFLRHTCIEDYGLDGAKILVAHDGFEPRHFSGITPYRPGKKSSWTVVYTGNLFEWKGVYTLVDSLQYLPENVRLQIVGGSAETLPPFQKYVAQQAWANRIDVKGFVTPTEIPAILEAADVLVLPNSARDPLSDSTSPLKLFEYMAARRPIVASRLPSLEEVLRDGKNARLFTPDDAQDLAKQIMKTISSDNTALVEQAFQDVQQFSWPTRAANIHAFLNRLGLIKPAPDVATNQPADGLTIS